METTAPIKVLYLITKGNWGGAQRYVYDLASALDRGRFAVAVAVGDTAESDLQAALMAAEIPVHHLPHLSNSLDPRVVVREMRDVWTLLRREQPHVLHVNSSVAGFLGALLGRVTGVPRVIFTAHGWSFNEARPRWQRLLFKTIHWLTVLLSHRTIAVSAALRDQLRWPGARPKMTVIHNARNHIDPLSRADARLKLTPLIPKLHADYDALWTVTIAELHPIKRHDVLLRGLAELRDQGFPVHHVCIGDGSERAALVALAKDFKLSAHVWFVGAIPEAARLLRAFDAFVLTSDSEAFGYAVLEARLAGLPVVATNVGGLPEIITDQKNGLLIPPHNPDALASALKRLHTDPKLRSELAAPHGEATAFSFAGMLQKTIAYYDVSTISPSTSPVPTTDA